ncbi:MAG: hypothetical protein RIR97_536 [Pseudomonadota bacterium]|jgi:hypothetical protein
MNAPFREKLDILLTRPATPRLRELYDMAYDKFGAIALWSSKRQSQPTIEDVLAITNSLRTEGNLEARHLAELIEGASRAAE